MWLLSQWFKLSHIINSDHQSAAVRGEVDREPLDSVAGHIWGTEGFRGSSENP